METVPSNFQQNMPNIGEETGNRPTCFKVVKSNTIENRSPTVLTKMLFNRNGITRACMHSLHLPDSQTSKKSRRGESASSNNDNSILAERKLVRRTLTTFSEKSTHFATKGILTKGS